MPALFPEGTEGLLLTLAKDADPQVRERAIKALGRKQVRGNLAIDGILDVLGSDAVPQVRTAAARTAGELLHREPQNAQTAARADRLVAAGFDDADTETSLTAILGLQNVHPLSSEALSRMRQTLHTGSRPGPGALFAVLLNHLGSLGIKLDEALALVRSKDPYQRHLGVAALGELPPTDAAIDALIERCHDSDEHIQSSALIVVRTYGPAGVRALGAVRAALRDPAATIRKDALEALSELGPSAKAALDDVDRLERSDPDKDVRAAAALARSILTAGN